MSNWRLLQNKEVMLYLNCIKVGGATMSPQTQYWRETILTSFTAYLRTGCASLLRGTGMPPAEGALGRGRPLLIVVVPAGLVRVALLILLEGFAGPVFCTTGGPGEEVVCVNCVVSWPPEPEPWLLNAFTGCRRANGDGAAGERNLPGEGTACRTAKENRCFQREPSTSEVTALLPWQLSTRTSNYEPHIDDFSGRIEKRLLHRITIVLEKSTLSSVPWIPQQEGVGTIGTRKMAQWLKGLAKNT